MHGYTCRLEELGLAPSVWCHMAALFEPAAGRVTVLGLLLLEATALPPQLASLSAFDGMVYERVALADGGPAPRQFVGALLTSRSPLRSMQVLSMRTLSMS